MIMIYDCFWNSFVIFTYLLNRVGLPVAFMNQMHTLQLNHVSSFVLYSFRIVSMTD